jgi:hypothetical protein
MRVKPDVTASLMGCPLSEQLSAGRGELHIGPGFVLIEPPFGNRALDTAAVLIRRATSLEKCAVDQLDINSAVLGGLDRVCDLHQTGGLSRFLRNDELQLLRQYLSRSLSQAQGSGRYLHEPYDDQPMRFTPRPAR